MGVPIPVKVRGMREPFAGLVLAILSPTGEMTELPVTWYAQERAWGMSPGFDRSDQPDFFRPVTSTRPCLSRTSCSA